MQRAMAEHRLTSRELVTQYLNRLALYDKGINAAISINPRALEEADARDRERAAGRVRGPLHGIPIALKDNIHTIDMPTTGGALAFANFIAAVRRDAHEEPARGRRDHHREDRADRARQLGRGRADADAGQLQRGRRLRVQSVRSAARSARVDSDGRPVVSTGGSSSGAGTAANFWAANVGSDTAGSVVNPAMLTMLVGIRPTTGRISRHGIIPITADQDTAGPMARTVTDAAILLGALESASPDPDDPATTRVHAAAGSRLHEVPERQRAEGRAHRHSARVLLRAPHADGRRRAARRRHEGGGRRRRAAG